MSYTPYRIAGASAQQPQSQSLELHPDRLFPADPSVRALCRSLYEGVRDLPIISPHGHVPAEVFHTDAPFSDPAALLVTPDHYLTRLLFAAGVDLTELGVGVSTRARPDPRQIWRIVCANWNVIDGTATQLWLAQELVELFGIAVAPSAHTADAIYEQLEAALADPEFRPRALYKQFGLEVLATTDSAVSALAHHHALDRDPSWSGRIIPTFRPDSVADPENGTKFNSHLDRLSELTGIDTGHYVGYLEALRQRRADFIAAGATCTDHGFLTADTTPLSDGDAARLFARARTVRVSGADAQRFRAHMLFEFARMSCDDGLVMQLHPGVLRDHNRDVFERYGTDVGGDIPTAGEFTRALRPVLNAFGTVPNFTLVVFTVDETSFSRELAPLAGHYPAMKIGAPWWFLDAPHAILRWREAVTETAGFYNTAGFVDDTRAFCSIPARHDVARRLDCRYLAGLVSEHRLSEEDANRLAYDLIYRIPKTVFRV